MGRVHSLDAGAYSRQHRQARGERLPARYAGRAVLLHWAVAFAIIALLGLGWYMVGIPRNTPERGFFYNLHKSVGILTAVLIAMLIGWRMRHTAPPLPAAMPGWERLAAEVNHALFYILMVLMSATGYLASSFSRFGPKLFGVPLPHWGWEDVALRARFTAAHRVTALVFAVLIAVHIGAALKHLLFDRDGVFERMLPEGIAKRGSPDHEGA